MNTYELQRRAIAAVAKLSIFAGATGCAGTVIIETETDTDEVADVTPGEAEPSDPPGATVDPPAPETTCFDGPAGPAVCCNELLLASFSDDHLWVDPSLATYQEHACCELAVDTFATWEGPEEPPFDWSLLCSCSDTGLAPDGPVAACSAWGPPMPPRMPPRMLRESHREAVLA